MNLMHYKIVFLNKSDLFWKKVQSSHINDYFSARVISLFLYRANVDHCHSQDYNGTKGDAEAGLQYFRGVFGRAFHKKYSGERDLMIHTTTATNLNDRRVGFIMNNVRVSRFSFTGSALLSQSLRKSDPL
ncbi:hypothetical protein GSI_14833 [Ganoderma sinense ZZ0214-1]|uniref:Uncharacterized protein n=1 Tax=Ganoderma sinense ZZ0214-1 TaxID=1077348 RepID=A0A2G8RPV0_9APHY|nr:hypothetical protein GSI_14833 [Ganoderma sinense ZZ0214-1]